MKIYCYFGIGNYYLIMVWIYEDLFFFIDDLGIVEDVVWVFNYIIGYVELEEFNYLMVLLVNLCKCIFDMIEVEIEYVCVGWLV